MMLLRFTLFLALFIAPTSLFAKTHKVDMVQAGDKFKYVPEVIEIAQGDSIVFTTTSGGIHTVTFYEDKVPGKDKKNLAKKLSSKKHYGFINMGQSYTLPLTVPREVMSIIVSHTKQWG